MKRSEINALIASARGCFGRNGWTLPPNAKWDVTDFGLGDWHSFGLVLVNLADQPEYCEKLMYAREGMKTPAHTHRRKKEDIICRWGELQVRIWDGMPDSHSGGEMTLLVNGDELSHLSGDVLRLPAGWRVTLVPGMVHEFYPGTAECIVGEVSTANDDLTDNVFASSEVGRFPDIEEDLR